MIIIITNQVIVSFCRSDNAVISRNNFEWGRVVIIIWRRLSGHTTIIVVIRISTITWASIQIIVIITAGTAAATTAACNTTLES